MSAEDSGAGCAVCGGVVWPSTCVTAVGCCPAIGKQCTEWWNVSVSVKYWRSWCNLFELRDYAYLFSSLLHPSAQLSVLFLFCALSFCSLYPRQCFFFFSAFSSFSLMHCSLVSTRPQLSGYLSAFRCAGGGGRLRIVSKIPGLALACDGG